jgi:hypothetical protein
MSTLTYTNQNVTTAVPAAEPRIRRSIWKRMFDALVETQQRRAEREIARYLASHGGLMTDGMEREMMRRLTGNDRRPL